MIIILIYMYSIYEMGFISSHHEDIPSIFEERRDAP